MVTSEVSSLLSVKCRNWHAARWRIQQKKKVTDDGNPSNIPFKKVKELKVLKELKELQVKFEMDNSKLQKELSELEGVKELMKEVGNKDDIKNKLDDLDTKFKTNNLRFSNELAELKKGDENVKLYMKDICNNVTQIFRRVDEHGDFVKVKIGNINEEISVLDAKAKCNDDTLARVKQDLDVAFLLNENYDVLECKIKDLQDHFEGRHRQLESRIFSNSDNLESMVDGKVGHNNLDIVFSKIEHLSEEMEAIDAGLTYVKDELESAKDCKSEDVQKESAKAAAWEKQMIDKIKSVDQDVFLLEGKIKNFLDDLQNIVDNKVDRFELDEDLAFLESKLQHITAFTFKDNEGESVSRKRKRGAEYMAKSSPVLTSKFI